MNRKTVRRSVALPQDLINDVLAVAPPELQGNWNRLVVTLLQDFIARRRREAFVEAMAAMAADADVRKESSAIADEFSVTEFDGLEHD